MSRLIVKVNPPKAPFQWIGSLWSRLLEGRNYRMPESGTST